MSILLCFKCFYTWEKRVKVTPDVVSDFQKDTYTLQMSYPCKQSLNDVITSFLVDLKETKRTNMTLVLQVF